MCALFSVKKQKSQDLQQLFPAEEALSAQYIASVYCLIENIDFVY
jgi:hypothetical protein